MPVKCSFIKFEIRDFMVTRVLLFGCSRQLIFIDVKFVAELSFRPLVQFRTVSITLDQTNTLGNIPGLLF